jgi:C4-dicarboxylate-specific signal transduction histidine kinase
LHSLVERLRSESDLRKVRTKLEVRVSERTADLEKANEHLRRLSASALQSENE